MITQIPIDRPLTHEEVCRFTDDGKTYLSAVILVDLSDLIEGFIEDLSDLAELRILPAYGLSDISYSVCGSYPGED